MFRLITIEIYSKAISETNIEKMAEEKEKRGFINNKNNNETPKIDKEKREKERKDNVELKKDFEYIVQS